MCTFNSRTSCGRFFIAAVACIALGEQTAKCNKRKDHCERATDGSSAKSLPPKMLLFFLPLLSCQTIGFLEFLANLTPIIVIMEERTKTI